MKYNNILFEAKNNIAYIQINRPKQLNALNTNTILELSKAVSFSILDREIKCIIITGTGEKAFVAGADIKEFAKYSKEEGKRLSNEGHEKLFNLLDKCRKPIIAAINGFALGGGLELAMACHIRIASSNAKMGLPEVSLGLIPGYGGTQRLANLVGKGKALEMITTASMITAVDAKQWGLVNYICTSQELIKMAEGLADKIINNSPSAISRAIKSINSGYIDGVDGYKVEQNEFGDCFDTDEFKEGVSAFLEKRKANF